MLNFPVVAIKFIEDISSKLDNNSRDMRIIKVEKDNS